MRECSTCANLSYQSPYGKGGNVPEKSLKWKQLLSLAKSDSVTFTLELALQANISEPCGTPK